MEELLLNAWRWALVALGVGLVIFVHELGHFLAARWCGVRVETFSLGFGPKLIGWRRGATVYQIAAVPLGGFVRMAGEESQGGTPAPDELPAKSVGQRFLIYSGGVLMNVAFALLVFPILLAIGVPFSEPVLGRSEPGSPAWQAGLEPGTRVLSVNGNQVYDFHNIVSEVALGSPESTVLVVQEPGAEGPPRTLRLVPERSEALGAFAIGVTPGHDPENRLVVAPGSPAARAGLRDDDRLVGVVSASPGLSLPEQFAQVARADGPVEVRVARGGEADARTFTITPEPDPKTERRILGVAPVVNRVLAVRGSPLARATGLEEDDLITTVEGRPVATSFDLLAALEAAEGPLDVRVERAGSPLALTGPALGPGDAQRLWRDVALGPDERRAVVRVTPGSAAAEAGLRDGDRIVAIDGRPIAGFEDVQTAAKDVGPERALALRVERAGETLEVEVAPKPHVDPTYGLSFREAQYVFRADGPVDAILVGCSLSWKFLEDSWLTLKRILFRQVSGSNVGGIITIGVVSHSFAAVGLTKLFYFLCMLSMNLAFLNVLPIPVLDGGHLMFLLVEKVKGSPVSERVHGYSQLVGVVLIVSLMLIVTFNDVVRWIVN